MKGAPLIKNDQFSHLYTLIVRKDNTFEVLIDNESVKKGSLFEDFEPSGKTYQHFYINSDPTQGN